MDDLINFLTCDCCGAHWYTRDPAPRSCDRYTWGNDIFGYWQSPCPGQMRAAYPVPDFGPLLATLDNLDRLATARGDRHE